eukprot:ANDGO_07973.mRNA.1 hypothetical protein
MKEDGGRGYMLLSVYVKPNASSTRIQSIVRLAPQPTSASARQQGAFEKKPGTRGSPFARLEVALAAQPQDNEANTALIQMLADTFKVPKSSIEITRGLASREKLVRLRLLEDAEAAMQSLAALILGP